MSKYKLLASILFFLTAILHFTQIPVYGVSMPTMGYTVFGVIYLILGFLLFKEDLWILKASLILPAVGILSSLFVYFIAGFRPSIYPYLVLIDLIIIILCSQEYLLRGSRRRT